jgi:formylmethanofuran dehydrogenase subunit E
VLTLTASINEAVAGDTPPSEAYALLETFHGHVCGGSLFGARLGGAAREALRATGGKGKLKAHYFDRSCPVDGIQVFAGTTTGNGAFAVTDGD